MDITQGDRWRQDLTAWMATLTEEEQNAPLLSLADVVHMTAQAKAASQEGAGEIIPGTGAFVPRKAAAGALATIASGTCDFLGYGLIEACQARHQQKQAHDRGEDPNNNLE